MAGPDDRHTNPHMWRALEALETREDSVVPSPHSRADKTNYPRIMPDAETSKDADMEDLSGRTEDEPPLSYNNAP